MHAQASLAAEIKYWHDVSVHIASPGRVATELLLGGEDKDARARKVINILAEDADTVAAGLVPRMRGVRGNGKYFKCASASAVFLKQPFPRIRLCALNLPGPGTPTGVQRAEPLPDAGHNSACCACMCRFLTPSGAVWRMLTARRRRGRFLPEQHAEAAKAE